MKNFNSPHNANLSMTLSNDSFAVNRVVSTYPSNGVILGSSTLKAELASTYSSSTNLRSTSDSYYSDSIFTVDHSNPYPDLIYVKIDNSIFNLDLNIKVIEYYVLLTYLVITNPNLRLHIRGIVKLLDNRLGYKLSKNTVNKYNSILIDAGLLTIQASNGLIILGLANKANRGELIRSYPIEANTYLAPRSNFTNFFPLLWDRLRISLKQVNVRGVVAKGDYILEHYFASKNFSYIENQNTTYKYKFKSLVITKDLKISRTTYYSKLNSLIKSKALKVIDKLIKVTKTTTNPITKTVSSKFTSTLTYINTTRIQVINFVAPKLKELRLASLNRAFIAAQVRKTKQDQLRLKGIHNSRFYHTGLLGEYMIKYNVNYSKFMHTIDPELALQTIEQLEHNYHKHGKTINARLISAALRGGWGS
jgi:hypothetical protein